MNSPTSILLAVITLFLAPVSHIVAEDAGPAPKPAPAARNNRAPRTATILKDPADWRLENLPIPPTFAPEIKLTGSEEIRFAPGMFDNTASSYFTCIVAIVVDGAPPMGAAEIKDFLEKYYRGLSVNVGRRAGLSPDPAAMGAVVTPAAPGPDSGGRFVAEVIFFDSFTDGRKIKLNVEAQVIPQKATNKTCLIFLISPSAKESPEWQTLHELGKKAASNAEN